MVADGSDDRVARKGVHGPYGWLTVTGGVYMEHVVRLIPEAVLNRYLAVTSYDSGIRQLSEEEIAAGWILRGDIAYSPRIGMVEDLKFQRDGFGSPGYDEWYIFEDSPPALGQVYQGNYFEHQAGRGQLMVFVNSPAFLLHDPNPYMTGILDIFWDQLPHVRPATFIADGQDCLTLVSKDHALIRVAEERLMARQSCSGNQSAR